jgi:hypothetical protein
MCTVSDPFFFIRLVMMCIVSVRAHAGGALCNFFNNADEEPSSPYIAPVLRTLLSSFPGGPIYLREQWVATLSSVATVSANNLLPFYRGFG